MSVYGAYLLGNPNQTSLPSDYDAQNYLAQEKASVDAAAQNQYRAIKSLLSQSSPKKIRYLLLNCQSPTLKKIEDLLHADSDVSSRFGQIAMFNLSTAPKNYRIEDPYAMRTLSLPHCLPSISLDKKPWEKNLLELQEEMLNDVVSYTTTFVPRWKINVLHLTTPVLNKIMDAFTQQAFLVNLENVVGLVSIINDQPQIEVVQHFSVALPPKDNSSKLIDTDKNSSFSPQLLRQRRASLIKKPAYLHLNAMRPIDQKIGEIFIALRKISAWTPSLRRWRFDIGEMCQEDLPTLQMRLNILGYGVSVPFREGIYRVKSSAGPSWVSRVDLMIDLPEEKPAFSLPQKDYILSPKSDKLCKEFQDFLKSLPMTKRLTKEQSSLLYSSLPSDTSQFMKTIESAEGIKKIAADKTAYETYPSLAFAAWLQNQISDFQLATFCLIYSAADQLMQNPSNNSHLIAQHFLKKPSLTERIFKESFHLSLYGMDQFKEFLGKAPQSEQCFFLIPLLNHSIASWSPLVARIQEVIEPFFAPLTESISETDAQQLIFVMPSFTMLSVLLKIYFQSDAIRIQPVLGNQSPKQIERYKTQGIRLIQLAMPMAKPPLQADGYASGGSSCFSLHDFYHAMRDSCVAHKEQLALRRINTLLKEALQKYPDDRSLKHLQWQLIDGELHTSSIHKGFQGLFILPIWDEFSIQLVLKDIMTYPDFWRVNFGITTESLP